MRNTFLISDPHINHEKIWPMRGFTSREEHDETIVSNWNSSVGPNDLVWCLGDVMLNPTDFSILGRLNGRKKLLLGNHDTPAKCVEYAKYFECILAYHTVGQNIIMSHIPVHPRELAERFEFNIHGHLHTELVLDENGQPDLRYLNVSAEQINLTPVSYDVLQKSMYERRKALGTR